MKYTYRAYNPHGREETGTVQSDDAHGAVRRLIAESLTVFELKPFDEGGKQRSVADFRNAFGIVGEGRFSQTRLLIDLATLTEAGLTLPQALRAILSGENVVAQRNVIQNIVTGMSQGRSAAQAFSLIEGVSAETVALVASGERSGQMPAVLRTLATQNVEREQRNAEIRNALAYPGFLLVLMCVALCVVVFVLVPALMPIFQNSNQPAPLFMRLLNTIYESAFSPVSQMIGLGIVLSASSLAIPQVRRALLPTFQRAVLALPVIGGAIRKANSARYLSSLSMLIGGGTPMAESLTLAANCNPLPSLRSKLISVGHDVSAGERLPAAIGRTRLFDSRIISLIAVGDEASRLQVVLSRASTILNDEAKASISRLVAAMTPAMTIVLGLIIGTLVISVMNALLSINEMALQ